MHDRDLRLALLTELRRRYAGDPSTLIVEEMGLRWGERRVDVAVVNGELHGYEIKSDADDLSRLEGQAAVYDAVLDRVTLVASPTHLTAAIRTLPQWWGIVIADPSGDQLVLKEERSAAISGARHSHAIAELFWRDEALAELEARGLASTLSRASRRALIDVLAAEVPLEELASAARAAIKARGLWRPAPASS